jgi:arylsulfatase A-like enzyme
MEKGVRSPLVVKPPGSTAGRQLSALVDLVDVHATVLDYAGAELPSGGRGRSLRPLLEGKPYEPRKLLCGAVYGRYDSRAPYALYVRDERWKYVYFLQDVSGRELSPGPRLAPEFRARAGQHRLYDLEQDPLEERNIAGGPKQVERVHDLRTAVFAWWKESGGAELAIPEGPPR